MSPLRDLRFSTDKTLQGDLSTYLYLDTALGRAEAEIDEKNIFVREREPSLLWLGITGDPCTGTPISIDATVHITQTVNPVAYIHVGQFPIDFRDKFNGKFLPKEMGDEGLSVRGMTGFNQVQLLSTFAREK